MSRGYYKTYGRKVSAPVSQASIQFDNLFCENSNRPSASKSAGTVGKWGITSFTSLRSTNFTLGRQDGSYKKGSDSKTKDFSNTQNVVPPAQPRPKKFFKSRNTEFNTTIAPSPPSAPTSIRKYTKPPPRSSTTSLKKAYIAGPGEDDGEDENQEQTEAMNLSATGPTSSSNNNCSSSVPSHNPPIVLRIFKGTSQLLTEDTIQQPTKKESRRRSHSNEHNDSVSPKRHKSKLKEGKDTDPCKDSETEEPLVSVPNPEPEPEPEPSVKELESEIENEKCIEQGDDLLASTYVDFQETADKLLDVKSKNTECEVNTWEEDTSLERNTQSSPDPPLEVQEEVPEFKDEQEEPPIEEPIIAKNEMKVEESTSDSESSEVMDKHNVVSELKFEPQMPKERPPKKGSIFKSRATSGEKRQAHYIHKWCDIKELEGGSNVPEKAAPPQTVKVEGEFEPETLQRVVKYNPDKDDLEDNEPITSVTCSKKAKEFYTVVRNVKKAHQIQESGEFQEFNDDVEYILDALQDNNPVSTRCLSAITLASKCMVPAFRMHVRAHGTVTKFFKALHDATKDQRLGMCTATVMFVLSQDRLNMDVDRDSLELMLNLLESETSHNSALEDCGLSDVQLQKTKERVRSLCQEIQEQGHGKHLNLDNITVGHLAMETLLSLTSRRAGEWFKEELRDLGGLEHIIKTVVDTCQPFDTSVVLWSPPLLDRMRKADRCLRVLENVTLDNEENNNYLLTYGDGVLVDTVVRVYRVCDDNLILYPSTSSTDKHSTGAAIRDCLMSILKVLINLTHDFNNKSFGSTVTGKKQGVIEASLHVLLRIPEYVPDDQKFDFTVLALILLINLVEHSDANRRLIIEARAPPSSHSIFEVNSVSAVSILVELFIQQEELARTEEKKTDAILDGEKPPESQQQKSHEEFIEETVAMLLQKAGRHMEHTLIAAYVAILLGYLTLDNQEYEHFVRSHMPDKSYTMMLAVLQKFFNFMTLTAAAGSVSSRGIKATEMLIKHLTETDKAVLSPQLT